MMKLLKRNSIAFALTAMVIALESGASEYIKGAEHFAAFSHHRESPNAGCAAADAADLTIGQPVTIVVLSKPQRLANGVITSKSTAPCAGFVATDLVGPFYEIRLAAASIEQGQLGVLIGKPVSSAQIIEGRAVAHVNGTAYQFNECTSSEAVHLTVRPLVDTQAKLVWHDYVYLGYDVDPTCTDKESAAIDRLTKSFNRNVETPAR
jgi:hypothetical protein